MTGQNQRAFPQCKSIKLGFGMDQNTTAPSVQTGQVSSSTVIQTTLGSVTLLVNVIALLVLLTNRALLRKSAFLVGVVISNICVDLGFFISGVYRIYLAIFNTASNWASMAYCLETTVPELLILTFCMPACVLLVIGVERLVAVSRPVWYRGNWNHKKSWYVLGVTIAFVLLSVAGVCVAGFWLGSPEKVTKNCSWIPMIGDGLTGYIYFISILGGSMAVVCTLISFCIGKHRFFRLPHNTSNVAIRARERKQLRMTKAMLCTATLDFLLVVMPNMFLSLNFVFHISTFASAVNYSIYTYNCNAVTNITGQLIFNTEFRKATVKFLHLGRFNKVGTGTTGTGGAIPAHS